MRDGILDVDVVPVSRTVCWSWELHIVDGERRKDDDLPHIFIVKERFGAKMLGTGHDHPHLEHTRQHGSYRRCETYAWAFLVP